MRFKVLLLVLGSVPACFIDAPTYYEPIDAELGDGGLRDGAMPDAEPCGNDNLDPNETCDGVLLDGADCTSAGEFTGGTLACNSTCDGFDTSGCTNEITVPVHRRPMNNTYLGSIVVAGSMRPTFMWEPSLAPGGTTVSYELQYSTDSTFGTGVTTVPTSSTMHQPSADLGVSSSAPVGARYFWRVRGCVDTTCSDYSSPWRVNVGRSNRDFNGDGYSDFVVGAPGNDSGGGDAGRAYMYFGGSGSLNTISDGTFTGSAGDSLGYAVASAGDVNADGFADVVVGLPGANSFAGKAYVYMGAAGSTFDTVPDGTLSGIAASDFFGAAVSSAGDVNGDGFDDVVIGAFQADGGGDDLGRAYVFLGGAGGVFDTIVDGTLTGAADNDKFGIAVSTAGDVNGDGYSDVVVGANANNAGGAAAGRAYVFLGGPVSTFDATADGILTGAAPGAGSGFSVASAGDMNADGFADVIIGAPYNGGGSVDIYFGGPGTAFDATPEGVLSGATGELLGYSVSSAGDVNCDGFDDVMIGAAGNDTGAADTGRAYVYFGVAGMSVNTTVDGTLVGGAGGNFFGWAVAAAGDTNADGCGDVVVGATEANSNGRAYHYRGSTGTDLDPTPDGTLTGAAADDAFGHSVGR